MTIPVMGDDDTPLESSAGVVRAADGRGRVIFAVDEQDRMAGFGPEVAAVLFDRGHVPSSAGPEAGVYRLEAFRRCLLGL